MITPEAFVLLTLPNATLKAGNATYDGILALECVTISIPQPEDTQTPTRDVYLVLRMKSFETPLDPSRTIRCSSENGFRYYWFLGGSGEEVVVGLHEPNVREPHIQEDLDTFDGILAQYAGFRSTGQNLASSAGSEKSEDLRGRVVIVNEDSGEVVGELDNQFVIQEDPTLTDKGREKEPVIIEIPEGDGDSARAAFVHAIPPEEQDIIMKGASLVRYVFYCSALCTSLLAASHAISGTTNLLLTAITSASSYVIKNSEPYPSASTSGLPSATPPPVPPRALVLLTSERTRKGLSTVHAMSGQAVQLSTMTIGVLDSMIKRMVGSGKGKERNVSTLSPAGMAYPTSRSRSPSPAPPGYSEKPPLPPRREASPQPPSLPPRSEGISASNASGGVPRPLRKRDRLLISVDLILSTIDDSAKQIMDVGGQRVNAVVGHKFV
jgi:spartin